ncbi:uncharacterized mitochondrial protein AtMg00810-like [Impatiens glandulifera]|uniref:uncharacterized mitochondrial protein AtMg00810-like n=1 Tax=Impatiens glandulifera TaxID=253017 RepID=UPI001FB12B97|nr:uncharacterized mitochondrial protein AtMg00810-like [Impatiens glandulifera]
MVVVLLYEDDIILTDSNYDEIARLQDEISLRFEMKKLGELGTFLGLPIENFEKCLFVSQINYAKKLIDKFGMTDEKKSYTPLNVNPRLSRDEGTCLPDIRLYRALVGSLIYLTIKRPDIVYAAGVVSCYMQDPRKPHFEEVKKILKYINTSLDIGLLYEKDAKFVLQGFADTDFAGDRDDHKSTSGLFFFVETLAYLGVDGNKDRTKHIELEHHFIREKVLVGIIEMVVVRSEDNDVDIFTKALPKGPFEGLRSKLELVHRTSL